MVLAATKIWHGYPNPNPNPHDKDELVAPQYSNAVCFPAICPDSNVSVLLYIDIEALLSCSNYLLGSSLER